MKLISDYELAEFRALAVEQMPSTCTVWRPTGMSSTTGGAAQRQTYDDVYTNRPFKLDGASAGGTRTVKVGNEEIQVAVRVGRLPADTELRDNDLVEITLGEHAGVFVKVIEATGQDDATEVHVPVYEVPRPKEMSS